MRIFLHIGLHKTGTTYLQRNIFPCLKDFHFAGKGNNILKYNNDNLIISNESFSGVPYHKNKKSYFKQFKTNIEKLNDIYNIDGVIIGFREPNSILKSFYKQHLHEKGILTFDKFFGSDESCILKPDDFRFSNFFSFLTDVFGEKRIFGYNHKDLIENHDILVNSLVEFLGTDLESLITVTEDNKSVGDNFEKYLIRLNKFNLITNRIGVNLYHSRLNKRKLTPRKIFQYRLNKFSKTTYNLDVFPSNIKKDWNLLKSVIDKK